MKATLPLVNCWPSTIDADRHRARQRGAAGRAVTVAPPAATTTQIDRIRSALAKEVEAGGLTIGTKGDFIVVEINNLLLFQSGKADAKPEFQP